MKEFALSIPGAQGVPVQIQPPQNVPSGGLSTGGGQMIQLFISVLIIAAILLSLFMLIWGGIRFMTSGGNKQELDLAKKTLVFSVIGLLFVLLSFLIINIIGTFFGISWIGAK